MLLQLKPEIRQIHQFPHKPFGHYRFRSVFSPETFFDGFPVSQLWLVSTIL